MSTSPGRHARLAIAKGYPQARCSDCGASLALVFDPNTHLARCAEARMHAVVGGGPDPAHGTGRGGRHAPPTPTGA